MFCSLIKYSIIQYKGPMKRFVNFVNLVIVIVSGFFRVNVY